MQKNIPLRRPLHWFSGGFLTICVASLLALVQPAARAQQTQDSAAVAPDAMVLALTTDVLKTISNDPALVKGDMPKMMALVDNKIMPNVNFVRMTSSAVGPGWRQATPEQRQRLQDEFKLLLIRTYAGALAQAPGVTAGIKPGRVDADARDVLIRTELSSKNTAQPIQMDYRLERNATAASGWKIYNVNVMGIWLVETYRSQFAQEVNAHGIDGLIASLVERNKAAATVKK